VTAYTLCMMLSAAIYFSDLPELFDSWVDRRWPRA